MKQNPVATIAYITPFDLAASRKWHGEGHLSTLSTVGSQLRLTSTVGAVDRETLVANDKCDENGWKSNMEDLRSTARVIRTKEKGKNNNTSREYFSFETGKTSVGAPVMSSSIRAAARKRKRSLSQQNEGRVISI